MKRIFSMLLCVLLLAGCGQPKEIPPYYPHDDTLRLDASVDEILAAQEMASKKMEGDYETVNPLQLFGLECNMMVLSHDEATPSVAYYIESTESDLSKEYEKWEKHFSKICGKPDEFELVSFGLADSRWMFEIDTGKKYTVGLSRYYHKNTEPKKYAVMLSYNEWQPYHEENKK